MRRLVLALAVVCTIGFDALPDQRAVASPTHSVSGAAIVQTALRYIGYPYTTVGNSPSTGFSCIGFVSYVYQSNGIPLPDNLGGAMAYAPAVSFSNLLPGDVLFFQNTVWPGLSHTAIYLGGGRLVHAAWYNRGVVISSFVHDPVDGNYWMEKYLGANRPWAMAAPSPAPSAPVRSAPAAPPLRPATPAFQSGPRAHVQVTGLFIRVRPSLAAPIRGVTTQGTTVVVLKQYRTWDWIRLPGGTHGWVNGYGIGDHERAASGGALPLWTPHLNGLRVRVRPGRAAPVVRTASSGQHLLVLKRWNTWVRVLLPDGARGWVRRPSLGPVIRHSVVRRVLRRRTVRRWRQRTGPRITAGVRIRTRPGLRAPVLGLAIPGTHVRILASWKNWVYVHFPGGRNGWVYRAYVGS